MSTVDYETTVNLYRDQFAFEDWLATFDIEFEKEWTLGHPDTGGSNKVLNASASFLGASIGNFNFTREHLVYMFGETAIAEEENRVAQLWVDLEGSDYL